MQSHLQEAKGNGVVAGIEHRGNLKFLRVLVPSENPARKKISHLIPLMNVRDTERAAKDFFLAWDPLWRGRVQAAIRSLSNTKRSFGMIMYAPGDQMTDEHIERVHAYIVEAFYSRLNAAEVSRWHARKAIRVQFLIYAAMRHYRDLVFGGGPTLGGPVAIDNYLYRTFGERLPSARKNWYRDWQPLWDVMIDALDGMEKKALAPISSVLGELRESEAA